MKLAKVNHGRCDDRYTATTYVWVPTETTGEQLQTWADAARNAFLKAEADFAAEPAAKFPGYRFELDKADPKMTVGEAQAYFTVLQDEYRAWEKRKEAAKHAFAKYLIAASGGKAVGFYGHDAEVKAEISWGHKHGTKIDYSEVSPTDHDFNAPKDEGY